MVQLQTAIYALSVKANFYISPCHMFSENCERRCKQHAQPAVLGGRLVFLKLRATKKIAGHINGLTTYLYPYFTHNDEPFHSDVSNVHNK